MMCSEGHLASFEEDRLMLVHAYEFMLVFMTLFPLITLKQSHTNPGRLVARTSKFARCHVIF